MSIATLPDTGRRFTHRETPLSGNSVVTSSRYSYPSYNGSRINQGILELRIALSYKSTMQPGESDEDSLEPAYTEDIPLTVSLVEKPDNSDRAFVDAYFFRGTDLKSHGYKTMFRVPGKGWVTYDPRDFALGIDEHNTNKGLLSDLVLDDDDSKLDRWGGLVSEMLKRKPSPSLIEQNRVYRGLKNNRYYNVRSQSLPPQLLLNCLQLLRHEEIPLYGALFEAVYPSWIFPPAGHPDSRERYLGFRISQAHLEDLGTDPMLRDQLPLVFEMFEKVSDERHWDSYLFVNGVKASHSYSSQTPRGNRSGHDRTFLKLKDYDLPIRAVVSLPMPHVLDTHRVIKKFRTGTLFEKDN